MDKKKKILLSIIGVGAILVPAGLLIIFSSKAPANPQVSTENRTINVSNVNDTTKRVIPSNQPLPQPSSSTSTPIVILSPSPSPSSSPSPITAKP